MILLSDSTERFFAREPPSDSLARALILIPMHVHTWRIRSRAGDISSEDLFLCENHLHALCNWTEARSAVVGWKIGLSHATQRMMIFQNIDSFGKKKIEQLISQSWADDDSQSLWNWHLDDFSMAPHNIIIHNRHIASYRQPIHLDQHEKRFSTESTRKYRKISISFN